jgi:FtsP/CotA-like multicopper oxidase with cupredoxin domain
MARSRRDFLRRAFWGAGALTGTQAWAGQQSSPAQNSNAQHEHMRMQHDGQEPEKEVKTSHSKMHESSSAPPAVSVQTPDIPDLPWEMDNGVKVFRLVAEPVKQQIIPGKILDVWSFNGSAPGPTIQITQGDRVRIIVDNHLPEPTSMHWHGFEIPHNMDGGPGISQDLIKPGGRFVYEFTLHQEGTYFYHSHMAMQEMLGMLGAFIMHPKTPYEPRVDKDFVVLLQQYAVLPNNTVPNSMNMEFNWLLLNGKAGPANTPLVVRLGDRVRIRLINLGMDHHPIHLHGHTFYVTGTEGGRIPKEAWVPGNTVLVGVAQARDFEFVANNPGDWMLHCHLPHHMMNQMSSNVGPMTRLGKGTPAGVSMENGMGMLTGTPGAPTGDDYGPSLGRGLGVGSTNDQPLGNTPLAPEKAKSARQNVQHDMPAMQHGEMHQMPGMNMEADVSPNANRVPGFPQDAYMEGPMMAMDDRVQKPQNYGLRSGWSGFMQGMMTFVRVLPPEKYDQVMDQVRKGQPMPKMPGMHHHG